MVHKYANIGLSYIIAFLSVAFTAWFPQRWMDKSLNTPWYECIRPSLSPPSIVFPIVWTTLYVLIGLVFSQVIMMPHTFNNNILVFVFILNLIMNILWTYIFFSEREVIWSLLVIGLIWVSIVIMMIQMRGWKRWALLPYLLWISFAIVLNIQSAMKKADCKR